MRGFHSNDNGYHRYFRLLYQNSSLKIEGSKATLTFNIHHNPKIMALFSLYAYNSHITFLIIPVNPQIFGIPSLLKEGAELTTL
jgi:hypothetical protein